MLMSLVAGRPLPHRNLDNLADPGLRVMADLLASPGLYAAVAGASLSEDALVLGIGRRIGRPWIDEADVTRMATRDERITAIGKSIARDEVYDCGVFLVSAAFVEALASIDSPGLSDRVRVLAAQGRARGLDISLHDWIDIDDPKALAAATRWMAAAGATSGG